MQINHGVNKLITLYKHKYESNEIELMDKYNIIPKLFPKSLGFLYH